MLACLLIRVWCFVCLFGVGGLVGWRRAGQYEFHYIYTRLFHN